jgi:hypothetical protein
LPANAEKGSQEGMNMPIRRYVEKGVFSADALAAMSKAFEATIWTLEIGGDEAKREAVAKFIIRSAQREGDFDTATLHRMAVAEFGGTPIEPGIIDTDGPASAIAGSVG